jgi:hypothetical protein
VATPLSRQGMGLVSVSASRGNSRHREDPTVASTAPSVFPSGELVASLVSRHLPDGEFGWGGISVTRQRRCPKAGSVGTELSRRTQA